MGWGESKQSSGRKTGTWAVAVKFCGCRYLVTREKENVGIGKRDKNSCLSYLERGHQSLKGEQVAGMHWRLVNTRHKNRNLTAKKNRMTNSGV